MEIFLTQILYLFRPILSTELVDWALLGFGFFDLAAILLFLLVFVAFSLKLLHKAREPVSSIEVWAVLFVVWTTISYLVHIDLSSDAAYAKLVIPPLTYILLKRILPDRATHVRMLFLMLVGFLLPFFQSAALTFQGEGVDQVVYWTGTERYKGVYANIHSMAHNAGFAMMLGSVYLVLRRCQRVPLRWVELAVVATAFIVGLYLLYATQTRSVYVGVAAFFVTFLFFYSKRALALFIALAIAFLAYFWESISVIFFDFLDPRGAGFEIEKAGSGRLAMWTRVWDQWIDSPFLNQLTGMGVTIPGGPKGGPAAIWAKFRPWGDPHNDWLFVIMSLGLIGFGILVGLFASILRAVLRLRGEEKFAMLALFAAVVLMNLITNSYITRFSMFQMFFMVIVYADLRPARNPQKT